MLLKRKSTRGHGGLLTASLAERSSTGHSIRDLLLGIVFFNICVLLCCDITAYREVLKESLGLQFFAAVRCVLFLHHRSLSFEEQLLITSLST